MTRNEWHQLAESQRAAVRQASAQQSLRGWDVRRRRPRDRSMDLWEARDAYKVQNVLWGIAGLLLVGWLIGMVAIFR